MPDLFKKERKGKSSAFEKFFGCDINTLRNLVAWIGEISKLDLSRGSITFNRDLFGMMVGLAKKDPEAYGEAYTGFKTLVEVHFGGPENFALLVYKKYATEMDENFKSMLLSHDGKYRLVNCFLDSVISGSPVRIPNWNIQELDNMYGANGWEDIKAYLITNYGNLCAFNKKTMEEWLLLLLKELVKRKWVAQGQAVGDIKNLRESVSPDDRGFLYGQNMWKINHYFVLRDALAKLQKEGQFSSGVSSDFVELVVGVLMKVTSPGVINEYLKYHNYQRFDQVSFFQYAVAQLPELMDEIMPQLSVQKEPEAPSAVVIESATFDFSGRRVYVNRIGRRTFVQTRRQNRVFGADRPFFIDTFGNVFPNEIPQGFSMNLVALYQNADGQLIISNRDSLQQPSALEDVPGYKTSEKRRVQRREVVSLSDDEQRLRVILGGAKGVCLFLEQDFSVEGKDQYRLVLADQAGKRVSKGWVFSGGSELTIEKSETGNALVIKERQMTDAGYVDRPESALPIPHTIGKQVGKDIYCKIYLPEEGTEEKKFEIVAREEKGVVHAGIMRPRVRRERREPKAKPKKPIVTPQVTPEEIAEEQEPEFEDTPRGRLEAQKRGLLNWQQALEKADAEATLDPRIQIINHTAVISDIHQADEKLDILIKRLKQNGVKKFVFNGDYLDGPGDSLETLGILADLEKTEGIETEFLLGNHDVMILLSFLGHEYAKGQWVANRGFTTLQQLAGDESIPRDYHELIDMRRVIAWLAQRVKLHHIDEKGFLDFHAGQRVVGVRDPKTGKVRYQAEIKYQGERGRTALRKADQDLRSVLDRLLRLFDYKGDPLTAEDINFNESLTEEGIRKSRAQVFEEIQQHAIFKEFLAPEYYLSEKEQKCINPDTAHNNVNSVVSSRYWWNELATVDQIDDVLKSLGVNGIVVGHSRVRLVSEELRRKKDVDLFHMHHRIFFTDMEMGASESRGGAMFTDTNGLRKLVFKKETTEFDEDKTDVASIDDLTKMIDLRLAAIEAELASLEDAPAEAESTIDAIASATFELRGKLSRSGPRVHISRVGRKTFVQTERQTMVFGEGQEFFVNWDGRIFAQKLPPAYMMNLVALYQTSDGRLVSANPRLLQPFLPEIDRKDKEYQISEEHRIEGSRTVALEQDDQEVSMVLGGAKGVGLRLSQDFSKPEQAQYILTVVDQTGQVVCEGWTYMKGSVLTVEKSETTNCLIVRESMVNPRGGKSLELSEHVLPIPHAIERDLGDGLYCQINLPAMNAQKNTIQVTSQGSGKQGVVYARVREGQAIRRGREDLAPVKFEDASGQTKSVDLHRVYNAAVAELVGAVEAKDLRSVLGDAGFAAMQDRLRNAGVPEKFLRDLDQLMLYAIPGLRARFRQLCLEALAAAYGKIPQGAERQVMERLEQIVLEQDDIVFHTGKGMAQEVKAGKGNIYVDAMDWQDLNEFANAALLIAQGLFHELYHRMLPEKTEKEAHDEAPATEVIAAMNTIELRRVREQLINTVLAILNVRIDSASKEVRDLKEELGAILQRVQQGQEIDLDLSDAAKQQLIQFALSQQGMNVAASIGKLVLTLEGRDYRFHGQAVLALQHAFLVSFPKAAQAEEAAEEVALDDAAIKLKEKFLDVAAQNGIERPAQLIDSLMDIFTIGADMLILSDDVFGAKVNPAFVPFIIELANFCGLDPTTVATTLIEQYKRTELGKLAGADSSVVRTLAYARAKENVEKTGQDLQDALNQHLAGEGLEVVTGAEEAKDTVLGVMGELLRVCKAYQGKGAVIAYLMGENLMEDPEEMSLGGTKYPKTTSGLATLACPQKGMVYATARRDEEKPAGDDAYKDVQPLRTDDALASAQRHALEQQKIEALTARVLAQRPQDAPALEIMDNAEAFIDGGDFKYADGTAVQLQDLAGLYINDAGLLMARQADGTEKEVTQFWYESQTQVRSLVEAMRQFEGKITLVVRARRGVSVERLQAIYKHLFAVIYGVTEIDFITEAEARERMQEQIEKQQRKEKTKRRLVVLDRAVSEERRVEIGEQAKQDNIRVLGVKGFGNLSGIVAFACGYGSLATVYEAGRLSADAQALFKQLPAFGIPLELAAINEQIRQVNAAEAFYFTIDITTVTEFLNEFSIGRLFLDVAA